MTGNYLKEAVGIGATFARYGLAEITAKHVSENKPIVKDMFGIVAADLLDGMVLRQVGMDTPVRRLADGITDYLSIARVGYEVAKEFPSTRPFIGALAVRSIIVGSANVLHQTMTGEITKSSPRHRLTTLAAAAFALTAVEGNTNKSNMVGAGMLGIALANMPTYFKELGKIHSDGFREV